MTRITSNVSRLRHFRFAFLWLFIISFGHISNGEASAFLVIQRSSSRSSGRTKSSPLLSTKPPTQRRFDTTVVTGNHHHDSSCAMMSDDDTSVFIPTKQQQHQQQQHQHQPIQPLMTPLEAHLATMLDDQYTKSQRCKCPFFRRRMGDILDGIEQLLIMTRLLRPYFAYPLQRYRNTNVSRSSTTAAVTKRKNMDIHDLLEILRHDWNDDSNGIGYYIHGRLTTSIYRNDCIFNGPDPDMPVYGLRKYLGVAPLLFDQSTSRTELMSIEIVDDFTIHAKWKMVTATLRLPWRPKLSEWSGTTTYYFDEDHLIYRHIETWERSVVQAFLEIVPPSPSSWWWWWWANNKNDMNSTGEYGEIYSSSRRKEDDAEKKREQEESRRTSPLPSYSFSPLMIDEIQKTVIIATTTTTTTTT